MVITIRYYGNKELEPKCIPQSFLGTILQGRRLTVIGHFFFPFLVTVPEAFAKLTRSSFLLGSKVANWAVVGRGQC